MDYFDNVWRSFRISWRHKYLWLIALFSGEGGGGGSFNFNTGTGTRQPGTGNQPDLTAIQGQVTRFLSDHAGLLVGLAVLWLVLVVLFFILAAVCEGATIRSSAEHDAERPWGLRMGWRAGVQTMWTMVRFRLLIVALALPILAVVLGVVVGTVLAFTTSNNGLGAVLLVLALLLVLPVIAYFIYLTFLDRLGSRALVLEQLGARAAIARAHRLVLKRLGRTLLVWLLAIAVGLVVGIATACLLAIVFIPVVLVVALVAAGNSSALAPLIVLGVVVLLPISLVIGGFLSAQSSTYWTLAFRRLEIDGPPVAYYTPAPPPPA